MFAQNVKTRRVNKMYGDQYIELHNGAGLEVYLECVKPRKDNKFKKCKITETRLEPREDTPDFK